MDTLQLDTTDRADHLIFIWILHRCIIENIGIPSDLRDPDRINYIDYVSMKII